MFSDNRIPVDTSVEPIVLEGDSKDSANTVRRLTEELNAVRAELGRLMQVVNNTIVVANKCEQSAKDAKTKLCDLVGIPNDGTWAIDYDAMQMVKVKSGSPTVV